MAIPRTVALTFVIAAGLVAAADAQSGQPRQQPPGSGPYGRVPVLSIRAQPNPIVFGSTTTISGSLRLRRNTANVRIILQSRSFSPRGTFANVSATTTDGRGDYRFVAKPGVNTVYRVLTDTRPVRRSVDLLVRVRTRVGVRASRNLVRAGRLVRFTGRVFPRHNGRRAYVQRRSPRGRWVTVAARAAHGRVPSEGQRPQRPFHGLQPAGADSRRLSTDHGEPAPDDRRDALLRAR
jgi:hypothetical protein